MARRPLLLAVAALPLAVGCSPIEHEFTRKVTYTVVAEKERCASAVREIDVSGEEELLEYRRYIKSIELKQVRVTITDPKARPDAVATTASGTLAVSAPGATDTVVIGRFEGLPLTGGSTAELTPSGASATRLGELLLDAPHKAALHAEGCVDAVPGAFTVEAEVTVRVRAGL